MQRFSKHIEFRDGAEHGMRPGFALSNWREGTWEVADNLLHQRRDRIAELDRRLRRTRRIYGGDCSWITICRSPWPALVIGERDWADYEARTAVRVSGGGRAGLAVRWEDARHCYYLLLENGNALAFYRREHDDLVELARTKFLHDRDTFYTLFVRAKGDTFECGVNGGPTFTAQDSSWTSGRVALVAECPAEYCDLDIVGTRHNAPTATVPAGAVPREMATIPIEHFDEASEQEPALYRLNGRPVIARRLVKGREIVLLDTTGAELFRLGPWPETPEPVGNTPLQAFDINGDGRDEVVLVAAGRIRVFDGDSGTELASCELPKPNVYGEAEDDPDTALVNDALCPVQLSKIPTDRRSCMGDRHGARGFYVKDRYWNIHLYNASLQHLWHRALNTGHFPLPIDIDGDGREAILCAHTLLDVAGNVVWKLDLNDHIDAIAHVSLDGGPERQLYLMAGEEGFLHVDAATGQILSQQRLGHVQDGMVGKFLPDHRGRQWLLSTLWREPSIYYLLDEELAVAARWENEPTLYELGPSLLPWGDRDLLIDLQGIRDPLTGLLLHEVPAESLHGQWVTDWPGLGPSRLVRMFSDRIVVYGPANGEVRYNSPVRPIHGGYLPSGPLSWTG